MFKAMILTFALSPAMAFAASYAEYICGNIQRDAPHACAQSRYCETVNQDICEGKRGTTIAQQDACARFNIQAAQIIDKRARALACEEIQGCISRLYSSCVAKPDLASDEE